MKKSGWKLGVAFLFFFFFAQCLSDLSYAAKIICKEGDDSKAVADVQLKLSQLGYTKQVATGVFDKETLAAVKAFQKKNKLKPTGVVDENTYQVLMKTSAAVKNNEGSPKGAAILKTARQYLGTPYRFGGASPKGFDCSGYTMYVFAQNQKTLPRTADVQFKVGTKVEKLALKEGDLVFFTTYEPGPSHVGIYYGNNKFIHASSSHGVMISSLNDVYWKTRYLGARRVL